MLRQRVARLVRETLSFSKKLAHHIGAIKYFICHYNLTRTTAAALPDNHLEGSSIEDYSEVGHVVIRQLPA
jgi:hypothetical protein